MKKLVLILPVLCLLIGCNALQRAQDFSKAIAGVLSIAQAEIPALPSSDGMILNQWVNLGNTLEGQLNTCINAASGSGSFAMCFNTFAAGLLSPTELAQLKILSAGSQSKVQLYATAIILGVNAALDFFGSTAQPAPVIAAVQPTQQELAVLRGAVFRTAFAR